MYLRRPPIYKGQLLFICLAGAEKIRWMKWKIIQYMVGYVTYLLFIVDKGVRCCLKSWRECH